MNYIFHFCWKWWFLDRHHNIKNICSHLYSKHNIAVWACHICTFSSPLSNPFPLLCHLQPNQLSDNWSQHKPIPPCTPARNYWEQGIPLWCMSFYVQDLHQGIDHLGQMELVMLGILNWIRISATIKTFQVQHNPRTLKRESNMLLRQCVTWSRETLTVMHC